MPPDERRLAVIATTEPLLLRFGAQLSTRQIAEAAAVAEGTLFRVFDNKDQLIEATVASLLDPQRTVDELTAIDPDDDLRTRLVAAAIVLQQRMQRFIALFGVLAPRHARHHDQQQSREDFLTQRRQENEQLVDALTGVIAPDADLIRVDVRELARLLQALVVSTGHPMLAPDLEHREPAQLVDLLLYGVATDPGHRTPQLAGFAGSTATEGIR